MYGSSCEVNQGKEGGRLFEYLHLMIGFMKDHQQTPFVVFYLQSRVMFITHQYT